MRRWVAQAAAICASAQVIRHGSTPRHKGWHSPPVMIVVETERLALRHLTAADARALEVVFSDPEVMRYSDGLQSPAWVRDWIAAMIEVHYPAWGFGIWAVVEKAEGAVIGYCGLERTPGRCGPDETEVGYRLARAAWGRGYGSEAAAAVCEYGLSTLGLPRIVAIIDPGNLASLSVARKIGMTYERKIMFEGYSHPDHLYAISKPASPIGRAANRTDRHA